MVKTEVEKKIPYNILYDLYRIKLKTIFEIEQITGVGHTTISKYLDKFNIEKMSVTERNNLKNKHIKLTDIQKEIVNGALLGDGSIIINKNNFSNGYFSYGSMSFEHVNYVYEYMKTYCKSEIVRKTNNMYEFRTKKYELFAEIWKLWYKNEKDKTYKYYIPDIKLTPLTCLIWYLGDGGMRIRRQNRNFPYQTLSLATNNFKKECIEDILISQLKQFNARIESTVKNNQYIVTIPRRNIKDFLDYIGECPFEDYKYKWELIPYQKIFADDDLIVDLYKNGYTYNEMHEITGCGITTLVTHVKKLKDKGILSCR